MTLLNDTKDENDQVNSYLEVFPSNEDGQILHLKRLLVTLKQHYEKNVHTLHVQLQAEQNQRIALQKDLEQSQRKVIEFQNQQEKSQKQSQEIKNDFENEIQSLQSQLSSLKEIL
ncbi:MAG: hypothetical protein Q8K60_01020, partial [Parachlamydiaceae bacterium]|nr:hypothetical protein [Parachlamydiaceae bacterium]